VTGLLATHLHGGELSQFVVHLREQPRDGVRIASFERVQDWSDGSLRYHIVSTCLSASRR
jgi:hypothetical protein